MYPFCRQVHYPTLNLGVGGVVAVFADLMRAVAAAVAVGVLPGYFWAAVLAPRAGLAERLTWSSVLFPAFVWLAGAVSPQQRTAWIVTFAMLQAPCAALFYTWRPLF